MNGNANYKTDDILSSLSTRTVHYRVKLIRTDGSIRYSNTVKLSLDISKEADFQLFPNPVTSSTSISLVVSKNQSATIKIFNATGALMERRNVSLIAGMNQVTLTGFDHWSNGIYPIQVYADGQVLTQKMILSRKK